MFNEILEKVKVAEFIISDIVTDKDSSGMLFSVVISLRVLSPTVPTTQPRQCIKIY